MKTANMYRDRLTYVSFLFTFITLLILIGAGLALAQSPEDTPDVRQTGTPVLIYLPLSVSAPTPTPSPTPTVTPTPVNLWNQQSVDFSEGFISVSCADTNNCYVLAKNGTIFKTTDGNNWKLSHGNGTVTYRGISCPASEICFAVGDNGMVMSTNDGGSSWRLESVISKHLNAVDCLDQNNCFVVGDESELAWTTDGGQNWTSFRIGNTPLYSVAYPSSGVRYSVGLGRVASAIGMSLNTINTGHMIHNGISCSSSNRCLMVGNYLYPESENGLIHAINNNSVDINNFTDLGTKDRLNDISCPDLVNCFIAGAGAGKNGYGSGNRGSIFVSNDDGSTWQTEEIPVTTKNLNSIDCPTAQVCYTVGEGGLILKRNSIN